MSRNEKPIRLMIEALRLLPGIGHKSAQKIAYHLLQMEESKVSAIANSLIAARNAVCNCTHCGALAATDPCDICSSSKRRRDILCIVESARDVDAIEQLGFYSGLYHCLQGLLNPLQGIGVEQIRINELMHRINKETVQEVILAISSTIEGEATAIYLADLLQPLNLKVTRLASGLPAGTNIEVVAPTVLAAAFKYRTEYESQ